jgi:hypothetical protein
MSNLSLNFNNQVNVDQNTELKAKKGKSEGNLTSRKLLWFRKGLRLHDSPSLIEACSNCEELYPVYIVDHSPRNGIHSPSWWKFLLESLTDLDQSFRK